MLGERFWSKVDKSGECWLWTASKQKTGYGQFFVTHRKMVYAHRLAYELLRGPIQPGLHLDHLCRNRACVNPAHLEPVTNRINVLRGKTIAAKNAAKIHCKNGHPFTAENTWFYKGKREGGRQCRSCYIERARKRRSQQARRLKWKS